MDIQKMNKEPNMIVFSSQSYTALEKNIVTLFSTKLPAPDEAKDWPHDREYTASFDWKILNANHKKIKQALEGLNNKKIRYINEKEKTAVFSSIYPKCMLQNGVITIHLRGEYVLPFCMVVEKFSLYSVAEYLSLTTAHAKRIFEMMSSYVNRDHKTYRVELDEFKTILGIENKYPRLPDFKKRVINPSIEQISRCTKINIQCDWLKKNNKLYIELTPSYKDGAEKDSKTSPTIKPVDQPTPEQIRAELNERLGARENKNNPIGLDTKVLESINKKLAYFDMTEAQVDKIMTDKHVNSSFQAFCYQFQSDLHLMKSDNLKGLFWGFLKATKSMKGRTYKDYLEKARAYSNSLN